MGIIKKEHKVIMLDTDVASHIGVCIKDMSDRKVGDIEYFHSPMLMSLEYWQPKYIYFISNRGLKKGDWYYTKRFGLGIVKNEGEHKVEYKGEIDNRYLKITATDDPKLTNLIYNGGDDYFNYNNGDKLNTSKLLPQIPHSFIESYVKKPVDKVELEYDEWVDKPYSLKLVNNEVVLIETNTKVDSEQSIMGDEIKFYTHIEVEKLCRDAHRAGKAVGEDIESYHWDEIDFWIKDNLWASE